MDGLVNFLDNGLVNLLLDLGLLGLTLGKGDDAASDAPAHTFSETSLAVLRRRVLNLVVVILTLVEDDGATNDGVGTAQVNKKISVLVLSSGVPAGLNLLEVTNTAIEDVELGVALLGAIGVEDAASRLAAILEVTVLMNFHSVETRLDAIELTNDASKVTTRLLLKLKTAARH